MATGNNGGRRGRRRGASPPPAACSSATVHGAAARSPACAPARWAQATRPSGPNGRHALMTKATRGNPPPSPLLKSPYPAPGHATLPRPAALPPSPAPAVRRHPPAPRQHHQQRRPPRTCRPPSATVAANASDCRARAPPALGACGGRTRASGGRCAHPCADCGKLPARVRTAAVAAAACGAPRRGAIRRRCVGGGGGASTVCRPRPRGGRPSAASQWGGHPRGGRIGRRRRQAAPGKCSRGGGGEWLAIHGIILLHSSTHAKSTFMNHHHILENTTKSKTSLSQNCSRVNTNISSNTPKNTPSISPVTPW